MTRPNDELIRRFLNPSEADIEFVLAFVLEELLLQDYDAGVACLRRIQRELFDTPTVH
jgi:hypothetical protein